MKTLNELEIGTYFRIGRLRQVYKVISKTLQSVHYKSERTGKTKVSHDFQPEIKVRVCTF